MGVYFVYEPYSMVSSVVDYSQPHIGKYYISVAILLMAWYIVQIILIHY